MKNLNDLFQEDVEIEYIGRIKEQYATLSKKQKRIANYIIEHKDSITNISINTLAKKTNTTPSTITRFCQTLQYSGFSEFKVYLGKNLLSENAEIKNIRKNDKTEIVLQKLIGMMETTLSETIRTMDPKVLNKVVKLILSAKNIVFFGQSGGYLSGLYAQQMFLRIGIKVTVYSDAVDSMLIAGSLKKDDLAFGICYSGESEIVVKNLKVAKSNGANTVAITAIPNSSITHYSDHCLYYSHESPDDVTYLHMCSICEIAIISALQTEMLRLQEDQEIIVQTKCSILKSRIK